MLFLLLMACGEGGDNKLPPVVWGDPDTGVLSDDTGLDDTGADDTGADDTGNGGADDSGDDTGQSQPSGQVCYPGPTGDWSVCLDVVDWSSAWGSDYDYPDPYNGSDQYAAPIRFIDLSTADPDQALAANFVLDEFMQEWKGRYGLFQPHVVEILQAVRDNIGAPLSINSGYRNPAYNVSVDGASSSRHQYGDAADMAASSISLSELGSICELEGADYVGYYESHVHCDWRNSPLEAAFYDARRSAPDAPLPEHHAELVLRDGQLRAPAWGWDEGEPLRTWRAWDAKGRLLIQEDVRAFTPPADAARVQVEVGRVLTREMTLPR